jgi:protein required for attachment to host cells
MALMIHVRIPARALVLVVDGKKARFLRNKGNALHIELVTEHELEQENPPTREQGTDRPGRYLGPDRVSRSAVEQTDWHQQAEDRFAVAVADILYRMAHGHAFDHLIVVAPPKVLGRLRAEFHPEVASRVVGDVPKELTSRSVTELAKLLG